MSDDLVRQRLASLFSLIDNRETESLQSHQLVGILNSARKFGLLVRGIAHEISSLEMDDSLEVGLSGVAVSGSDKQLVQTAIVRGFVGWEEKEKEIASGKSICPLTSSERRSFLLDLLADLHMCRLQNGGVIRTSLSLTESSEESEQTEMGHTVGVLGEKLGLGQWEKRGLERGEVGLSVEALQNAIERLGGLVKDKREQLKALPTSHLLLPDGGALCGSSTKAEEFRRLQNCFAAEYRQRVEVLLRRLDVTLESFMWSAKAQQQLVKKTTEKGKASRSSSSSMQEDAEEEEDPLMKAVSAVTEWKEGVRAKWGLGEERESGGGGGRKEILCLHDAFCLPASEVLSWEPISNPSRLVPSKLRSVTIGRVIDRGGVPEGYTETEVQRDVGKANERMKAGDGGSSRGGMHGGSKWTGHGVGVQSQQPHSHSGGRGGG
eukprot:Cvel_15787.t1-p1 / transcript=Cvel_15787.t1 / gene=Cvel_15787 / organism=Chromera_velia_CCMP2878 / gene_product=hypothetical protein / transcript_product=hypothetical protein / location=Cvel_scaffold1185:1-3008(-) / protein_length=434 / sequence_SO=supercontig / SO=protein_coding / is_pseudo=false